MVQKSILSFFSGASAKKVSGSESAGQEKKNAKDSKATSSQDNDSPVKKVSRKSRVIDSDSEDEAQASTSSPISKSDEEKENKKGSPTNKSQKITPSKSNKGNESKESNIESMETDSHKDVTNGDTEAIPTSSQQTPSKKEMAGLCVNVGFTPETVPPLRKTARKQIKRKSDGLEDKQIQLVKKMKEEDKDKDCEEEANDDKTPKKGSKENKKEEKEKNNIKEEEDVEEPMEVDDHEGESKEVKEDKKTSTPPVKKPIHSFFAPRSPTKTRKALEKFSYRTKKEYNEDEEEEEEEETGSSPVKKQKPATSKKRANVISSDSEEEDKDSGDEKEDKPSKQDVKEEKKVSPKKIEKESPKNIKKKSPKNIKKESPKNIKKESPKEIKKESPKKIEKESPKKEGKQSDKIEKKPVINPFAPKPAGAGDQGVKYNPGKDKYDPIKDAFWGHKEKVPYLALAKTFELIEGTSGRLKNIEILANFLRSVIVLSPDDILKCIYLCLNKVAPAFEGLELEVGDTILMRAIAETSGRSVDKVKADAKEKGDLGIVAEHSRSNQKLMFQPAKLTVHGVFEKLKEIAHMTGHSSQNKKGDKIKGMFVACRFSEARYLIRSLSGKLRIGLAEQSVLQAIAQACFLTPPGQAYPPEVLNAGKGMAPDSLKSRIEKFALTLKTTYCEFPSYDKIVAVIMEEGLEELPKHCKLTPGIPLKPMLAHPTSGVSEVLKRFENAKFTCEFKYDGERAQIHMKEDGSVKIYSRNQEDNTSKYPDIIARLKSSLGENVKSCVIDSEAVAWDKEKKQILPFQILSTRKRKDANEKDIKVQVCVFPFDLLYFNGEPLVREPFEKRRALLKENFNEVEGEFVFAKSMDSTNTEDIEEFLEESIKGDCEGLMVKTLDVDATYEIAKRSHNWLKLKKDYLDGVGDTIDAVVIGGYWGKGKRKGVYGCFLLACYDPDNEEFQSLCKIGTGFSEEQLQSHTTFLKEHVIDGPKSYYRYDSSHEPDTWFDAVQVWEVKCADLSVSPHHKAASGIVDPEKGISLRFPRYLRIRDDKTPENSTSASQIADLYNSQAQIKNKAGGSKDNGEDFY